MDASDTYQLIILIILLALSAFFSSNETALMAVNKIRLRALADEGNKRAAKVLDKMCIRDSPYTAHPGRTSGPSSQTGGGRKQRTYHSLGTAYS